MSGRMSAARYRELFDLAYNAIGNCRRVLANPGEPDKPSGSIVEPLATGLLEALTLLRQHGGVEHD